MKYLLLCVIALFGVSSPAMADGHGQAAPSQTCCFTIPGDVAQVLVAPSSEAVRRIQAELAVRGFNPGPVDGVIGPRTMTALRAFQRDEGLLEGLLTVETLSRLGIQVNAHRQTVMHPAHRPQTGQANTLHQPGQPHVIRRVVESRVVEPASQAPARTGSPNYVSRSGAEHRVAPLVWPGKTRRD